jgi:two-component system nitrogen regulation response regulator NtrX
LSRRADKPLIEINCAAIPEELIESELFGHEKGSFTGAVSKKKGKFDLANQGTLFLDEIGDMSMKTQSKILRILQERRFERVGGSKTITVDVRVLAATNKDLEKEIEEGRFREDLYYRLNVIPIVVPPLRERTEDIPELADEFLRSYAKATGGRPKRLSSGGLSTLMQYRWPGNVRELKNFMERLAILSPEEQIPEDLISRFLQRKEPQDAAPGGLNAPTLREARQQFERAYIAEKLAEHGGNVSQTAFAIGIERSHLHKKMKSLGLTD